MTRSIAIIALGLVGCFTPKFDDGKTPCSSVSDCPSGLYCAADNRCWHAGRGPTMAPDMATSTGRDDLGGTDMPPQYDLALIYVVPTTIWISSGGGSCLGPATGDSLNMTIGAASAVGAATGAATGGQLSFGFFNTDAIQ